MDKVNYDGGLPDTYQGFENITRYWDEKHGIYAAKLGPGDFYVSRHGEMITTVLGSCVAACVRDPFTGIGGMNHFMLPMMVKEGKTWEGTPVSLQTRYGNIAMEKLINVIMSNGGKKSNFEIKLFGGGKMFDMTMDIGQMNIDFIQKYIVNEGFTIKAEDLGGNYPRKIQYYPLSGRVRLKKLYRLHNETIIQREIDYKDKLDVLTLDSKVEIFK